MNVVAQDKKTIKQIPLGDKKKKKINIMDENDTHRYASVVTQDHHD